MYLSIKFHCTQLVPLTRSNTYRNVASRLLAGLVTVEQARTTASFARKKRDARYRAARKRAARKRLARDRDPTAEEAYNVPPGLLASGEGPRTPLPL